ncbi:DUF541 domain-containing protein, partial [Candidatus Woesearchaeota archaeon]|nr:DUF541 domain-containing protein [Candidatus Woesearchaeota archaeon]
NTINVSGESELTVDPDEAEVWAGISIVELTAEEAQSEANEVINNIIDGLRYKGISEEDIETERLNLYEEKRYEDGEYKVVGWRASQTLKISTEDLDKVGEIVDVCVENGANQINRINFGLSEEKEQEYKKEALAKAASNAKAKAVTIAESLGVKLGEVKTVSEAQHYYRPYGYMMETTVGAKAVEEAAQVMPQKVDITGQINLVYNVR